MVLLMSCNFTLKIVDVRSYHEKEEEKEEGSSRS